MPLFSLKISPKKIPLRKQNASISSLHRDVDSVQSQQEFGLNYGPIKMQLGDQACIFQDGVWIIGGPVIAKQLSKLKKQNAELVEQNNLLNLKVDLLLDMLAEKSAELQQMQDEELRESRQSRKHKLF